MNTRKLRRAMLLLIFVPVTTFFHGSVVKAADDIIGGQEEEVGRIRLGHRGTLVFANEIRDVIDGESTARIYLERNGRVLRILREEPGLLVESYARKDFDGDGLDELALLWRSFGRLRRGRVELFDIRLDGGLEEKSLAGIEGSLHPFCELLSDGFGPDAPGGTVMAVKFALCSVSLNLPMIFETVYLGARSEQLVVLDRRIDEWTRPYQALNVAAEYYRQGRAEDGLRLSRNTLERIRLEGDDRLMADAFRLVAEGYRRLGNAGLAAGFERRARLKEALQRESLH